METFMVYDIDFYRPLPKTLQCLTYNAESEKLAGFRADDTIEIWDVKGTPYLDRVINVNNGSIETLLWADSRLFATGDAEMLIEYDTDNCAVARTLVLTSGTGWCIAKNDDKILAVGTSDGFINLIEMKENDLEHDKLFHKCEGPILSIVWSSTGNSIISGGTDAIYVWNVQKGQITQKLPISRSTKKLQTDVWCIALADDFTIVSGDSRGKLTFWDAESGMYLDSHQSHQADILAIAVTEEKNKVYCAGIDPVISSFEKVTIRSKGNESYKWVKSIQRSIHTHDVKSLVTCANRLFSAGVDSYLAVSSYPPNILHKYSQFSQCRNISLACGANLIAFRYDKWLEVWDLSEERPTKLVELKSLKNRRINCSAFSPDGQWIAYSTSSALRIFRLTKSQNGEPEMMRVENCTLDASTCIAFSPCSKYMATVSLDGKIIISALNAGKVCRKFILADKATPSALTNKIVSVCLAEDCKYIVAYDRSSNIAVWKESRELHCSLPKHSFGITAMAINSHYETVLVSYSDQKIVEFSLVDKKFTDFSRTLDSRHAGYEQWQSRANTVEGILVDESNDNVVLLYDQAGIYALNKRKEASSSNTKRPRLNSTSIPSDSGGHNSLTSYSSLTFTTLKSYEHLLFAAHGSPGRLVVVEVKPEYLVKNLPPALKKKKFGAM